MRYLGLLWPIFMLGMMVRRGIMANRQRRPVEAHRFRRESADLDDKDQEARFTILDYVGWALVALLCGVIVFFVFRIITATG